MGMVVAVVIVRAVSEVVAEMRLGWVCPRFHRQIRPCTKMQVSELNFHLAQRLFIIYGTEWVILFVSRSLLPHTLYYSPQPCLLFFVLFKNAMWSNWNTLLAFLGQFLMIISEKVDQGYTIPYTNSNFDPEKEVKHWLPFIPVKTLSNYWSSLTLSCTSERGHTHLSFLIYPHELLSISKKHLFNHLR